MYMLIDACGSNSCYLFRLPSLHYFDKYLGAWIWDQLNIGSLFCCHFFVSYLLSFYKSIADSFYRHNQQVTDYLIGCMCL